MVQKSLQTRMKYRIQYQIMDNNFPIIPIAIAVVVAIIIIIAIAKKASKKSGSPIDVMPEEKGELIPPTEVVDEKPLAPPMIDTEKVTPPSDDEGTSRLKKTFPPKSDEHGSSTSSSDEKTGDWFKSADIH